MIHAVEVAPDGVGLTSRVEIYGEEVVTHVVLGVDVDMRTRVVGVGRGLVDLAYGDVLYGRRGEYVERDEFVVGVGRGYGLAVEGGDAVTVSQTAYDELSR